MQLFGGVEAGGTKFICGVGTNLSDLQTISIPTTSPDKTIAALSHFFHETAGTNLAAVGIGSFGPIDLDQSSPTYGHITSTPKPGWRNFDLVGSVARLVRVPVGFDTDVNASALAEHQWGAARGLEDFIYLTIGTGIGGGVMAGGRLIHGLKHPELGHIRVPHDLAHDPFLGSCPFHSDCLEGLASGPAIRQRWDAVAEDLPDDHPAWALEAEYLALALSTFVCTLSPRRIILGGGVMHRRFLFPMICSRLKQLLNGYISHPALLDGSSMDTFIVPPGLGANSGLLGAILLAKQAFRERQP